MPAASWQHTVNAAAAFRMDNRRTTMTEEQQRHNGKASKDRKNDGNINYGD